MIRGELARGALPAAVAVAATLVLPTSIGGGPAGHRQALALPRTAPQHRHALRIPRFGTGARIGTIRIARLHATYVFRQGISANVLQFGPGHYPQTKLPGQPGTVAIAGHRVTHTRPFLRINLLRAGDLIVIRTSWGTFRYSVYAMRIVRPTAVWVLMRHSRTPRLVLTACHPPHTATFRIVVFARQVQ
jgi:LPXTG-site transpeptidase (sortase) family protein